MEIVVIKTGRHLEIKIVKGGEETLDGEIARYPVQEGVQFKIKGGCEYECPDAVAYTTLIG